MFRMKIAQSIILLIFGLVVSLHGQQGTDSTIAQAEIVKPAEITQDQIDHITSQLIAPCCWSETANLHKSPAAKAVQEAVLKGLKAGRSEESIKAAMIAQYGERILATPKLEGFNYFVFILPVVVLLIGGYIVWVYLFKAHPATVKAAAKTTKASDKHSDQIEKELKEFEG
ncbi:MAG: hypothetical protein DWQ05_06825 [Calditrichaeota bacterium]|nr:MAG: hypothetical protein DWQ05_06825 [Calditrichota bacterium]